MTDYDTYLDRLMADCRRSVQCPNNQPPYFETPPIPLSSYSFKNPQTIAPQPCISRDLPATAAAPTFYTPKNIPPAAIAPRPCVPGALPPPATAPRPESSWGRPPAAAATAPPTVRSRNLSPAATAPSPFVPSSQIPIASSISACTPQKVHKSTSPDGHAESRQDTHKDCTKRETEKAFHTHYKNMYQHAMREELKARGLLSGGPNADLVKRLIRDDNFQAKPRTAENYDTMSTEDNYNLCVRRSITSQGTFSSLKDRLKAHDERGNGIEAAVPGLNPSIVPGAPLSALEVKNGRDLTKEKPLVQSVKGGSTSEAETAKKLEETAETVALAKPMNCVKSNPINGILLNRTACSHCRKRKRRCTHDSDGNVDPLRVIEPTKPPRHPAYIIKVPAGIRVRIPTPAVEEVAGSRVMRSRVPDPKALNCQILQTVKNESTSEIETAKEFEETAETVTIAKSKSLVEPKAINDMLPGQSIHKSCNDCRKGHRRCTHDSDGEADPVRVMEPTIPRPNARKSNIKDTTESTAKRTILAMQKVAPKHATRLRLSLPKVSASQNDNKPTLDIGEVAGTRLTRPRVSNPKASTVQTELRRPARTGHMRKDAKRKTTVSNTKRPQTIFQPKDEVTLLQICVKLKDVIAWGRISGFWTMVQDTLQLKTGKSYKKVSRHVRLLVDKRRAEQQEVEQEGKISISRVSAGCRPLLDKWIVGGNRVHHVSPNTSTRPAFIEDKDDISLGKEGGQQLDSEDSAVEVQKRSATDAWLDTSCGTMRCKKLKLCTSELTPGTSKSFADSMGCWSLSGSSVTSESSIEGDSEDEDKDEDGV